MDPLIEEAVVATVVMSLLGAFVALLYWAVTDLSPWPYVILGELAAFGFGIVLLTLTSPKRR